MADNKTRNKSKTKTEDTSKNLQTTNDTAASLKVQTNAEEVDPQISKPKVRLYKKFSFWLILISAIVLLGLVVLGGIYISNQNNNKKLIKEGWGSIVRKSESLVSLSEKVQDKETFENYIIELKNLTLLVSDSKLAAEKLKQGAQDAQLYKIFLNDFYAYTTDSLDHANRISDFTDSNAEALKANSLISKDSSETLKNSTKYLTESMPDGAFDIQSLLSRISKVLLVKDLAIKSKELAEQDKSAKDMADKKLVEASIDGYMSNFLIGNAAKIRQYMTEEYQKEFDFSQLTAQAREYSYPSGFRVLSTQKSDGGKYKSEANIIYKLRDGSSQYTVGNEINLVYNADTASWLVNSIRESSGY